MTWCGGIPFVKTKYLSKSIKSTWDVNFNKLEVSQRDGVEKYTTLRVRPLLPKDSVHVVSATNTKLTEQYFNRFNTNI